MVLAHGSIYLKWHQYKVAQKEHKIQLHCVLQQEQNTFRLELFNV
jgi:hypothetical protein